MIIERVGGLRSGVPTPEGRSVLRTFRKTSLPLTVDWSSTMLIEVTPNK